MTMANRIGVMNAGRLEQVATPRDLYEAPASRWIAGFVGDVNLFDGEVVSRERQRLTVATGDGTIVALAEPRLAGSKGAVSVAIRPEKVRLSRPGPSLDKAVNHFSGLVADVGYLGSSTVYKVKLDSGTVLRAAMANTARLDADGYGIDQRVVAWFAPDDCVVLDR